MLAEEYRTRGLSVPASESAVIARVLAQHRGRFGRGRQGLKALGLLGRIGRDLVQQIRQPEPDPTWLQAPERASYPLPKYDRQWTAVDIAPNAREWLVAAAAASSRRTGHYVQLEVWLRRSPDGPGNGVRPVVVLIGQHEVGTLPAAAAHTLEPYFSAADFFDEDILASPGCPPQTASCRSVSISPFLVPCNCVRRADCPVWMVTLRLSAVRLMAANLCAQQALLVLSNIRSSR